MRKTIVMTVGVMALGAMLATSVQAQSKDESIGDVKKA